MISRHRAPRRAWSWVAAILLGGCPSAPPDEAAPSAPPINIEPLLLTSSSAITEPPATPSWFSTLPKTAITAKPGDRVWATLPVTDTQLAEPGLFTLDSIYGEQATLIARTHERFDKVPGALIHRAKSARLVSNGDPALVFAWATPAIIARVIHHEAGHPIRVAYDWSGLTKEMSVDHAEPLRRGVQPFAYVGFPQAGAIAKGLLIALTADQAWLYTASGHVERRPRSLIQALNFGRGQFAVAKAVHAYRYSQGFQLGAVSRVLEPGMRYRVSFGGQHPERDFFFTDLVIKP